MGLMLMNLNDTEREGDGRRMVINWKILLLYFRSRKRGHKYAYEAILFLSHAMALYNEKTKNISVKESSDQRVYKVPRPHTDI